MTPSMCTSSVSGETPSSACEKTGMSSWFSSMSSARNHLCVKPRNDGADIALAAGFCVDVGQDVERVLVQHREVGAQGTADQHGVAREALAVLVIGLARRLDPDVLS